MLRTGGGMGGWSRGPSIYCRYPRLVCKEPGPPLSRIRGRGGHRDDQRCPGWTRGVPAATCSGKARQPVIDYSSSGSLLTVTRSPPLNLASGHGRDDVAAVALQCEAPLSRVAREAGTVGVAATCRSARRSVRPERG